MFAGMGITGNVGCAVAVPRETWVETMAEHGMVVDRSGAYIGYSQF